MILSPTTPSIGRSSPSALTPRSDHQAREGPLDRVSGPTGTPLSREYLGPP